MGILPALWGLRPVQGATNAPGRRGSGPSSSPPPRSKPAAIRDTSSNQTRHGPDLPTAAFQGEPWAP